MFILPAFQGKGIGKALSYQVIAVAKQFRYDAIRLDTDPKLKRALDLYRKIGFMEIDAYRYNPNPNALFFELNL